MVKSNYICRKLPQRWIIVFLGFLGNFSGNAMRICLPIAIVEMTIPPKQTVLVIDDTCSSNFTSKTMHVVHYLQSSNLSKYDWSEYTQGLILSSFYWGYLFTNLLGGAITQKIGGKYTLGLSVLSTSLFTLITPLSINLGGSTALIILRVAMGIGGGAAYPALNDLLSHWIPENERSKAGSMISSGATVGTIFGLLISGVILQHSKGGWPMVFYLYGIMGLVCFLLNTAFCYSKPSENPFISDKELEYLKRNLNNKHANLSSTPWIQILKSPAVWALVLITFANTCGFYTIISDLPKYMSSVLKFSIQENGYLSSIPLLAMLIGSTITCFIADKVISKQILSITSVRKICCTISSIGPAVFLVGASYAGCDGILVITLLSFGMALMGCAYSGLNVNALDLSPNYASSITGLVNGIAVIAGMISPNIVGILTPDQMISEWRAVFWIIFAVYMVCSLAYLVYGSGEVQEWNDPKFSNKKTSEE